MGIWWGHGHGFSRLLGHVLNCQHTRRLAAWMPSLPLCRFQLRCLMEQPVVVAQPVGAAAGCFLGVACNPLPAFLPECGWEADGSSCRTAEQTGSRGKCLQMTVLQCCTTDACTPGKKQRPPINGMSRPLVTLRQNRLR